MPMLLEDLAQETSASNQRAADRLDAEARDLRHGKDLGAKALESARQAIDYAVARVPQDEGVWHSALAALGQQPRDEAEHLLRSLLEVFASGLRLVRSSRSLWEIAAQTGAAPERLVELDRAERRFEQLVAEVNKALLHRAPNWQPSDPARLARGLELAEQGKALPADEARAWFRNAR